MISAEALIAKFRQALDEGWGYIWGQSGGTWTQAKQNASTRSMTVQYGSRWIGKRVADCSGLFAWAFRELGGSIYHGSNTIWNKYCSVQGKLTSNTQLRPGTAVFLLKNGNRHHIGLFVGNDTVIEARSTQTGVVTSKLSHWDEWGELKDVLYDEHSTELFIPILRKGSKGNDVKALQESLLKLGFSLPKYGADGKFGAETEMALRSFQEQADVKVDGKYGPITRAAMTKELDADVSQEPLPSERFVVITSVETVGIHSGNDTSYERIAFASNGDRFPYVAIADNGWFAIKADSCVGWVSDTFSKILNS
ncbi:MAG: peptidoglycan-binding protein [Christensenellales bacterium]|jgi:hypothetical protein